MHDRFIAYETHTCIMRAAFHVYARLSVCLSWCHISVPIQAHDSAESLLFCDRISCRWVRRFPSNESSKEEYPLRSRYFIAIGSSSVRTVADKHRLVAVLLIIASTADELSGGTNVDDLERLWTPK